VREQAERLRQPPLRLGVGGKTLVEHHRIALEQRVAQIGEHLAQMAGRGHRLVADHLARQADHVEVRVVRQGQFGASARTEQRALEACLVHAARRIDEHLAHARTGRGGERPAGGEVHRHLAPAGHHQPLRGELGFQHVRGTVVAGRIEEHQPGGETRRGHDAGLGGQRAQPARGPADQHAAAVAADAVGIDAAAMGKLGQRRERGIDQRRAGAAVDLRDQAEAAAVVLEGGVVKRACTWRGGHGAVPPKEWQERLANARRANHAARSYLPPMADPTKAHLLRRVKGS
jgi:hypothetical protein